MKKEISAPAAIAIIVVFLVVVVYLGFRRMQGPTPPPVKAPMGAPVVPPGAGNAAPAVK